MLSQGALRVGFDARLAKASSYSEDSGNDRKRQTPVRPLRVLSSAETTLTSKTAMENLYASRQDQPSSAAGFHASSQQITAKPKRIQIAAETTPPSSQTSRADQENELVDRPKRVIGLASLSPQPNGGLQQSGSIPAAARSESSASQSSITKSTSSSGKPSERQAPSAPAYVSDKLEEAISSLGSNSWSVRLDAAEYIGGVIQRRIQQQHQQRADSQPSSDARLDDRILPAFIKHMSDAHYRVAQAVLKSFLSLLKLTAQQQLQPQLKTILPKLFQKQIETKESTRVVAKENLDYIAQSFDASVLTSIVIPLLMEGGNMKVKAAVCHYLRELLPHADVYMKQSNNNNHMRSFLGKIAQLLEGEMPVSVTSACGGLIYLAARLYGSEMEAALPLLPPTKRTILSKLLKTKGIVVNLNSAQSSISEKFASSNSSRGSAAESDNQVMEPPPPPPAAAASRKRSESPNANSASPQRTIQKRKSADDTNKSSAGTTTKLGSANNNNTVESSAMAPATEAVGSASAQKQLASLEDLLSTLTENNATERERRTALHRVQCWCT